jgi:Leucine-rich repeat (LRR) protein
MTDEKLRLILHPGADLALGRPQSGRIVTEMVGDALALSRAIVNASESLVPRYKIGEHVFCEPDYRQILLWAGSLQLEPLTVIERLLAEPDETVSSWWTPEYKSHFKTHFVNGRIVSIYLNGAVIALESLEWVEGLVIESIAFQAPAAWGADYGRALPLPQSKLCRLYFYGFNPSCFDLSAVPNLIQLVCENCGFTELDLRPVSKLQVLVIKFSKLSRLDLSAVPLLKELDCQLNILTQLDLSAVPLLKELDCNTNELINLDLSSVPVLSVLNCHINKLTQLDLSAVPLLKELDCMCNILTHLKLSAVPLLTVLDCSWNILTQLDLSTVPLLTELDCSYNQLTQLDLSAVPLLTKLDCSSNHLTTLDIRPLHQLESLVYDADQTLLIQRPDQNF